MSTIRNPLARALPHRLLAPAAFAFSLFACASPTSADHVENPTGVAVAGSFQQELGCPGDWQPECPNTELSLVNGVWQGSFDLPAGYWEYKVALNDGWAINFGDVGVQGGDNVVLILEAPRTVTFRWDPVSHAVLDDVQPLAVTMAGSFQEELGCPGDWQPECAVTGLSFDPADGVWQGVFDLPAGNWEYKAPLNGNWNLNYGANAQRNGPNLGLSLDAASAVKFYFDDDLRWVTSDRNAVIATAAGNFQSELGCPGDWQPDCLRSWLRDADGDGTYEFTTRALPAGDYEVKVAHNEGWAENYGAGGVPNGPNIPFTVASDYARTVFSYDPVSHVLAIAGDGPKGNLGEARAHWLDEDTLAWNVSADSQVALHFSDDGSLVNTVEGVSGGMALDLLPEGVVDGELAERFRHLAGQPTWRIPESELWRVPSILKGQFVLAARDPADAPRDATAVQHPGVLDDLYANDLPLGVHYDDGVPEVRLWAPTARSVNLLVYPDTDPASSPSETIPMVEDPSTGTWSLTGDASWDREYYLFEVEVYVRGTGQVETNRVTDPYSLSLARNSTRSQFVDLEDADLKPRNWDKLIKAPLAAPEDIALYELHVRDFSIGDTSVSESLRGTFAAFGEPQGQGMRHLRSLARAGLTHVHLLPAFDCATIEEDRSLQEEPAGDLSAYAPDSTAQQAAVDAVKDADGFNWCYDPYHYTVPEGSYATEADGPQRILEFREMVAGLAKSGLRVVMDVVYNHTSSSGQNPKSVLDRVVPGYYHRLNEAGFIERSTCCENTATEHAMMERLMVDSLLTWARAYKVDGFRFDLMGHHSRPNIERARDALAALTPAEDGVDGSDIYLYGEGWNFGEVANDARFDQATQANMGEGTGVGSFNDRLRDAVRGGGPFDSGLAHVINQGFINGLYTDPNGENSGSAGEREWLLALTDKIRVGLAGSLEDFVLEDRFGNLVTGAEVDHFGLGAGYVSDPQEAINYIAAHDNETLFDINQYKLPLGTSPEERVRAVNLGNSIVALAQGVPFFHAGQDMLRSKSMDRNSYNSGDWFNLLDFSYEDNGWGRGLPPESENQANWDEQAILLADPTLAVEKHHVRAAVKHLREMLRIRNSSPLFRLTNASDVNAALTFHNTGPDQVPGLIVMSLESVDGVEYVVLFNGTPGDLSFDLGVGVDFELHPVLAESHDPVVRTSDFDPLLGRFHVPARTTAVFQRRP